MFSVLCSLICCLFYPLKFYSAPYMPLFPSSSIEFAVYMHESSFNFATYKLSLLPFFPLYAWKLFSCPLHAWLSFHAFCSPRSLLNIFPWQKGCQGNTLGCCQLKIISNDVLHNYPSLNRVNFYSNIVLSCSYLHFARFVLYWIWIYYAWELFSAHFMPQANISINFWLYMYWSSIMQLICFLLSLFYADIVLYNNFVPLMCLLRSREFEIQISGSSFLPLICFCSSHSPLKLFL